MSALPHSLHWSLDRTDLRQNRTPAAKWCPLEGACRGTLIATFLPAAALTQEQDRLRSLEQTVFSCDYNGWADVPEDEREALEVFEAGLLRLVRLSATPPLVHDPATLLLRVPERRAA
jgi:hypothetical protein